MHKDYDKYKLEGDIHWQWYNNMAEYHFLVDDSIRPFLLAEPGRLVDIGCGDGLPLSLVSILGFKCYGVDPEYDGINLALEHGVSAEYFVETAEKFAERNMEFDYLYSLNTIEHMDDPTALVAIMRNVKKFGIIITDDGSKHEQINRYHETEFTDETFRELFKDFNLEKIAVRGDYIGYKVSRNEVV